MADEDRPRSRVRADISAAVTFAASANGQLWRAVMETTGPDVVRRVVEHGLREGLIRDTFDHLSAGAWKPDGAYMALLDLLDANGDQVEDYVIPSPEAFEWWRRALDLRPCDEDDLYP